MSEAPRVESQVEREIRIQGPVVKSAWSVLTSRPVLAVVSLLALALLTATLPGLKRLNLFSSPEPESAPQKPLAPLKLEVGEAKLEQESLDQPGMAQPEHAALPSRPNGPIAGSAEGADLPELNFEKPPLEIADKDFAGLKGFYHSLSLTRQKRAGAVTRVVHFGDSIVTSDYVSGTLRRKLQSEFGDAGHGFMLMANAWPAYFHNDVYRFASSGWLVSRIVGPLAPDGWYGLGGVSFRAPPGSRARFGTAKQGKYGRAVSRYEVAYVEQPDGGEIELRMDGQFHTQLSTAGPEKKVAYRELKVSDGEHELEVVTKKGTSRVFGVVMERDVPGVVLDAIGIQGARVRFLDKQDDTHWAETLRWRKPALLIYEFGANESGDGFAYPMADYQRTLKEVLRQGKAAVPDAGCLVIAAMDRAEKRGTSLSSMAVIPALVAEQKKAAAEVGCAFFDTYRAMGGPGSMAAWVQRGLGQADLTHPTGSGSEVLGNWIFRALLDGYARYQKSQRD